MSINDAIIQVRFESIGLNNLYTQASKNVFVLEYLNTEMYFSQLNIDKKNKIIPTIFQKLSETYIELNYTTCLKW